MLLRRACGVMFLSLSLSGQAFGQDVGILEVPALVASTPVPGSQRISSDFNGDGYSDLAWVNPFSNQFAYWTMGLDSNGRVRRQNAATFSVSPGYFAAAIGDVNGDGFADLVWTGAKRDLYLWLNDGTGHFRSQYLTTYPIGWTLLGAGDVDGDGSDDLLWQDVGTCQIGTWFMKNGVRVGLSTQTIGCGYTPIAIGYFTPTKRISIVMSSDLRDLMILDSEGQNFVAYDVSTKKFYSTLIGFGGGLAGQGIVAAERQAPYDGDYATIGSYQILTRQFDADARQSGFVWVDGWVGSHNLPWAIGATFVRGSGAQGSSLVQQYGNGELEICPPAGSLPPGDDQCTQFSYPRGWFMVGAPANGAGRFGPEMTP